MATTKISDVIVPELFSAYVSQRTTAVNRIIQSGIAISHPEFNALASSGGRTLNMPFWNFIGGDDEVLDDSKALTPDKMSTSQDIAARLLRGKAWASNILAGALAGSDPMRALGDMVAVWWATQEQKTFVSILRGVFASATMVEHINDKSTANISGQLILDTKQKLGDNAEKLKVLLMHSAVKTELQKQNLISTIPTSRGEVMFDTFLGYPVIVDDTVPNDAGVYNTYLFGNGTFGRGEGVPTSMDGWQSKVDSDILAGEDVLAVRKALVLHPFGVRWIGNVTGSSPTNAELATGTNWERIYESKNVPMVMLKHKIGA